MSTFEASTQPWWSSECGHYSIMHALRALGNRIVTLKDIRIATKVGFIKANLRGVDETQLIQGINNLGYKAVEFGNHDAARYAKELVERLKRGPCIIPINNEKHWITLTEARFDTINGLWWFKCVDSSWTKRSWPVRHHRWIDIHTMVGKVDLWYGISITSK